MLSTFCSAAWPKEKPGPRDATKEKCVRREEAPEDGLLGGAVAREAARFVPLAVRPLSELFSRVCNPGFTVQAHGEPPVMPLSSTRASCVRQLSASSLFGLVPRRALRMLLERGKTIPAPRCTVMGRACQGCGLRQVRAGGARPLPAAKAWASWTRRRTRVGVR